MSESSRKPRALVVDDDDAFVDQFTRILQMLGYDVTDAKDGLAALELCRRNEFDIAMIDIRMPRLNGISFVNNVRRISPKALSKIIFVTSLDDATLRHDAMAAGGTAFLVKPVTADAIIAAVGGVASASGGVRGAAVRGEGENVGGNAGGNAGPPVQPQERRSPVGMLSNFDAARDSFARQGIMATLGATLTKLELGVCEITLPFRRALSQQHGFFHAGVISTVTDSAAGYAAYTMFPTGSSVLTAEFKINLLAPADGESLRASGRVIKHGKTLTICEMQAFITKNGEEKLCAYGISTLVCDR